MSLKEKKLDNFRNFYRSADFLLLDDIQSLSKKHYTQEEFFHMFNELYLKSKQIILTTDRPISQIKDIHENLISRFSGGLVLDIKKPDLETRIKILKQKAVLNGIVISEGILFFIAQKLTCGNAGILEGIIKNIKIHAKISQKNITQEFIEQLLYHQQLIYNKQITVDNIIAAAASQFNLDPRDITSANKSRKNTMPRYIAIYLVRKLTDLTLEKIGEIFGRSHASIISAINKPKEKMKIDADFLTVMQTLEEKISAKYL